MRLRIFTEPQQGATYDQLLRLAAEADRLGFDAFFRSDHYLHFGSGDPGPGPTDAWITLAGLARETTRIRLGTLVSPVTFRWPGALALAVAQVDAMSGGRVELGLGAGWNDAEHAAYGIPFPPTAERFDRLEEALAVITGLWRVPRGERFSYDGRHYRLADSPGLPKPVQAGGPPIVIGGWGARRTPRLAATYAAEYNLPFSPPEACAAQYDRVRAACERAGRDPGGMVLSTALTTCCGADEAEAGRRAARIGQTLDQLRSSGLGGTPAEVVERIATYAEAGVQVVYLQLLDIDDLDHLRLLAAEVLPAVG